MSAKISLLLKTLPAALLLAAAGLTADAGAVAAQDAPNTDAVVRQLYDGKLLPDREVQVLSHIDKLFPSRTVKRGPTVKPLPPSDKPLHDVEFTSQGRQYDLYDYMADNRVSGLLILKDGKVAFEDYELGATPDTHWMSASVAKSFTSTLIGAAVKDGYIKSLDDPITRYLPVLAGGGYDGVSVRNVMQMASGVRWDETYTNPKSDRRHMLDLQLAQQPGSILKFMATLPRAAAPGTKWNYSTGETQIVGALVGAATHMTESEYLSKKIWSKIGVEHDATWWLDSPDGIEIGGSGFGATLRDYARFGQFLLDDQAAGAGSILPPGWLAEAGSSKVVGGKNVDYGYLWWPIPANAGPMHHGAFRAAGIFGQFIYMNPAEHVVVVVLSARPKPSGAPVINDNDFFGAVVQALH